MDGLTHYTRTREAVAGILENGFAWVPNRRNLMPKLLTAGPDFSTREPQQFGMISFTDWTPPAPPRHREAFGNFGIVVSRVWARARKPFRGFHPDTVKPELRAQRVIYIEDGPCLDALRWLYTTTFEHLNAPKEDQFALLSATSPAINRAMAGVQGDSVWANLLALYEYLEDGEHAYQSEWRITSPVPRFGYPPNTREIINAVLRPTGWNQVTDLASLKPPAEAVIGLVCPREEETAMRHVLPSRFSDRQIVLI